jgi:hypothetical protein
LLSVAARSTVPRVWLCTLQPAWTCWQIYMVTACLSRLGASYMLTKWLCWLCGDHHQEMRT